MFRSYMSVAAILCLAAVVGCDSESGTTGGSGGTAGGGGAGGSGGAGTAVTKAIGVGCTNSFTADVSSLEWELTVEPGPIVGGEPVDITFDGVAFFTQAFLDVAVLAIPGLKAAALNELNATALPRSGLTGEGVLLHEEPIPTTCSGGMNAGEACTTDADCEPVGYFSCAQLAEFPISEDCTAGGECDTLGKLNQCNVGDPAAGFCITGDLPLPLGAASGTFTAGDSGGTALLGWDDQNTGATLGTANGCAMGGTTCDPANDQGDGSNTDCEPVGVDNTCDEVEVYILPPASFVEPLGPIGLKVTAGVIQVALNCTMAVDSGLDPTQVSPTPDADLISFPIE